MIEKDEDQVHRFTGSADALGFLRQFADRAQRTIDIFSHQLSPYVFDDAEFVRGVSQLVRRSAQSQLRILVRDPRPLYGCDRPLLSLAMRLPTHSKIRVYTDGASSPNHGFVCCDQSALVYFADEPNWTGFARVNARAEARSLLEEFNTLWTYGSKSDPNLRRLTL